MIALRDRDERVELKLLAPGQDTAPTVVVPSALDHKTCKAVAPREGGADADEQFALGVQDTADVALGEAGVLCLSLMDRNANMADFMVRELLVGVGPTLTGRDRLAGLVASTGAFDSSVEIDVDDKCKPSPLPACKGAKAGAPWIEHEPPAPKSSDAWPHAYDPKTAKLSKGAELLGRLCPKGALDDPDFEIEYGCAELESSSPSGRYQVLAGLRESGDYIYRNLLVLDRKEGVILSPPGEDPGPDGKRVMTEVAPAAVMDEDKAPGVMATGETEVVWLPGERLWIGGTLLIPEQRRAQYIGGTLARAG